MTGVRTRGAVRCLGFAVDSSLFVGLLLITAGISFAPAVPSAVVAADRPLAFGESPGAELAVDPPSFWMRSGENLSLQAIWSSDSPACSVASLWYRWSVEEGTVTGFLNATSGPSTTFTADSFGSGNLVVEVRSDAVLNCGSNETVVEQSNSSRIVIVVPLSLSEVEASRNPLTPGETATLEGTVRGGAPPYSLQAVWGDGTRTVVAQAAAGNFSINHTFESGEFAPYVLVQDSEGDLENRSVDEALSVGSGFQVAVLPSSLVAEVGAPVTFTGIVTDPPPGEIPFVDCTNATIHGLPGSGRNETSFTCTFHSAGTAEVLFGEYPPYPGGPSASAILYEPVVLPPELGVAIIDPVAEVGSTALVEASLSGGTPPFVLRWNLTGNRSGGSEVVDSDGEGVISLTLTTAGEYGLGIRVVDGTGGVATNFTASLETDPTLDARASEARTTPAYGVLIQIVGGVLAGCPPFSWWAIPGFEPVNGSDSSGSLETVGTFSWNGAYSREGSLSISVGVADACGAGWQTVLRAELVPTLLVNVWVGAVPSVPNGSIGVNLEVQGGWPPFELVVNGTGNVSWNRSVPSTGTYRFDWETHANGSLSLTAIVRDSLGAAVTTWLTVTVPAQDPNPPPLPPPVPAPSPPSGIVGPLNESSGPSVDGVGLLASFSAPAAVAVGVAILWRRRSRKGVKTVPGPDPVEVLKQIIEPAEGAERFTVELLAEEAGIPLAVVRSTIDRLVSQGSVRSESGADGEEVLSWSTASGR